MNATPLELATCRVVTKSRDLSEPLVLICRWSDSTTGVLSEAIKVSSQRSQALDMGAPWNKPPPY